VSRSETFARWFPWPLVSVTLLLGLLIIVTPVLSSSSQPAAGTIFSQAELVVDGLPSNATTHFYVHGLGTTARYLSIVLGFAFGFNWTGGFPSGALDWSAWQNGSDVLSVSSAVDRMPVAVNVTAVYVADGASATYAGMLAFDVVATGPSATPTLEVVSPTSAIPGFSSPVSALPVTIVLPEVASGGAP
jgi:hypothetical protein